MAGMKRFVTYIYSYENREKGNNVGFAKIEIRGEECRMELHLRGLSGNTNAKVSLFRVEEGGMQGFPLGELIVASGAADFRTMFRAGKLCESSYSMYDMEGIILFCEDEQIFMSRWSEGQPVTVDKEHYKLWEKPAVERQEEESETDGAHENIAKDKTAKQQPVLEEKQGAESPDSTLRGPETENQPTGAEQEADSAAPAQENVAATEIPIRNIFPQYTWEEIWDNLKTSHAMYTPFVDESIACLRIELKDIRSLPKRYWYLGNNSFLLHGFFNYHYLIIGRKSEHYFLGVPGIFQHQERVMATIFGFPEFLPTAIQADGREQAREKEEQQNTEPLNRFGFWFRYMED